MLRLAFTLLGLAAIGIGGMIFALGPAATADMFAAALALIAPTPAKVDGLSGPNVDSEMRFYAVLWVAYGALALWVARDLAARIIALRLMLAAFLIGGVGRAVSLVAAGPPHPLFAVLMWIELLAPPAMIALSFGAAKPRQS